MSDYIGEEICLNMKYALIIVLCVVQVMSSNDFDDEKYARKNISKAHHSKKQGQDKVFQV